MKQYRQGDVCLNSIKALPQNLTEVPAQNGRIILAYGEVTGHCHQIDVSEEASREITDAAIARARLWRAEDGSRFVEVVTPVALLHEEHTSIQLPAGFYSLPSQVEYSPAELRKVTD